VQVFGLQSLVYRGARWASRLSAKTSDIAALRRDVLRRFNLARRKGLSAEAAAQALGVSRATLYRWSNQLEPKSRRPLRVRARTWSSPLIKAVHDLRDDYPMWGKAKLGPLLREAGYPVCDSTVGRILKSLMNRGLIHPVPRLRKNPFRKPWSPQRKHAMRLPKGLKPSEPGGVVQIDTVFITLHGRAIKHFTAYDPVAKWTVAQAASRATAKATSRFLDKVLLQMPFKVQAIQVDGGSEFKAEFEQACADKGLILYELPPKRPQLNGAVERCNGAWRYEFYAVYDLPRTIEQLNPLIDGFQHIYNHFRPHGALAGKTPASYLQARTQAHLSPSHMY
jgi:putative transposase